MIKITDQFRVPNLRNHRIITYDVSKNISGTYIIKVIHEQSRVEEKTVTTNFPIKGKETTL